MTSLCRSIYICLLIILSFSSAVFAIDPGEALHNPDLENRARILSRNLRCLVCQNQSIDDSDAPLARDLRQMIRTRLLAGDSDDDILTAARQRYGDFILLRPPLEAHTIILWFLPFVFLIIGGVMVRRLIKKG